MSGEQRKSDRRQAIVQAAQAAFDTHGYAATTMDQVAAVAGISKGSIYNYFKSKEELFEQVFTHSVDGFESQALEILAQPLPATEKLSQFLDHRFKCTEDAKHMGRLVLEAWATAAREQQGRLADLFRQIADRWRQRVSEILAEGAAAGEFVLQFPPPFGAALILALLDGIEIEALLGFGPGLNDEYRAAMKGSVLAALKAPKDQPPAQT